MKELVEKAKILIEALPYIQVLSGKTVVIKYGGSAMNDEKNKKYDPAGPDPPEICRRKPDFGTRRRQRDKRDA